MANWKENFDTQEEGTILLREEGKGEAIFETTKDFGFFLRNVEIIVLVEACGQIGQKQIGQIAFVDVKSVSYRL